MSLPLVAGVLVFRIFRLQGAWTLAIHFVMFVAGVSGSGRSLVDEHSLLLAALLPAFSFSPGDCISWDMESRGFGRARGCING